MSSKWARIRKILNTELNKTLKEVLVELYQSHSINEISRMCIYHCGRTALRDKMIELNIEIKSRGRRNSLRKIEISDSDLQTLNPKEIAAKNNVSIQTIQRRIKERTDERF